jgi:hypothetical protein
MNSLERNNDVNNIIKLSIDVKDCHIQYLETCMKVLQKEYQKRKNIKEHKKAMEELHKKKQIIGSEKIEKPIVIWSIVVNGELRKSYIDKNEGEKVYRALKSVSKEYESIGFTAHYLILDEDTLFHNKRSEERIKELEDIIRKISEIIN